MGGVETLELRAAEAESVHRVLQEEVNLAAKRGNSFWCLEEAQAAVERAEEFRDAEVICEQRLLDELRETTLSAAVEDSGLLRRDAVGQGSLAADLRALRVHSAAVGVNAAGENPAGAINTFVETSCVEVSAES